MRGGCVRASSWPAFQLQSPPPPPKKKIINNKLKLQSDLYPAKGASFAFSLSIRATSARISILLCTNTLQSGRKANFGLGARWTWASASMNSLQRPVRASPSLLALNEWQEKEKLNLHCAVDEQGFLLDNLTLELRVHPPQVHVDNSGDARSTVVTIDSANRPGSLIFVSAVQSAQSGKPVPGRLPPNHQHPCPFPSSAGGPALHGAGPAHKQCEDLQRRRLVPRW